MKSWLWILITIIVILIFIGFCVLLSWKNPKNYENKWQSQYIQTFKQNPPNIKLHVRSSPGLINDAVIVAHTLKHIPPHSTIHFEILDNPKPNDFFYLNGDCIEPLTKILLQKYKNHITILTKTKQIHSILKKSFPRVIYTGFTSKDCYVPNIKKDFTKCIHVAGQSPMKNTDVVMEAWRKHPEWPHLTIIARDNIIKFAKLTKQQNVSIISEYIPDDKFKELLNTHGIHICCSQNEGFGHYINEARSVGAVILYSNAPSMNEFFNSTKSMNGIPLDMIQSTITKAFVPVFNISIQSIEQGMIMLLNMQISELQHIGNNARQLYLSDKTQFENRLINTINSL